MKVFHKLFQTKASSVDDNTKSVTFVISTNQKDRYGDVVDQKSWDFKSYLSNPIVLWGHNPDEPENVLGTAADLQIAGDGSQTTATLSFDADINPKAGLVFDQIKRGTLRTVSVGFRNHTLEYDDDDPILKDNELLEISVVPIPANAGAVAKELKAGNLHVKDARWLMDSMRKEVELIDEELTAQGTRKEKQMTPEQATALIDGMAKLTDTVTAQQEQITELTARLPEPETDEQRTEREAKEAEEAKAAKEAENVAAGLNPDGSAKPGKEVDQGGAEKDEFDENAEVTPEQQVEIDAAIDAELELQTAQ